MKPSDLPKEKPRLELKDLPADNELIAIREELRADTAQKTGGLLIYFKDRQGHEFSQKYSTIHTEELTKAMDLLKLKDTAELQKSWYKYKMTAFRMGFPRYIPTKKV